MLNPMLAPSMGGRTLVRSIWIVLDRQRFAAKITAKACWISLDFLGFSRPNRDFSMGYGGFSAKIFSSRFFPLRGRFRTKEFAFDTRKGGVAHWASLSQFLISCNQLSRDPGLQPIADQAPLISAAARRTRPTSVAEGRHSDHARPGPPSRWRGPPLSDGSHRSTGSAFYSGPRPGQSARRQVLSQREASRAKPLILAPARMPGRPEAQRRRPIGTIVFR